MRRFTSFAFVLLLAALPVLADDGTYGEPPQLSETTPIADILARPHDFEGKTVQVQGPVKEVCEERGCWLRVGDAEGALLLAKSSGDKITVPTDSVGRSAMVEGVVVIEHEGEAASSEESGHACATATVRLETRGVRLL